MRTYMLSINGQLVDLPANLRGLVRLDQARSALSDLGGRIGEGTRWPLTLPDTRPNSKTFGPARLHPIALDKFGLNTDFAYRLECSGEVFTGTFRLTSLKAGYTGNLIGDGFSWAVLLGEKKLPDLQVPGITYTGAQLETIQQQTCDTSDVQAPLISWGNFFHPPLIVTNIDGTTEEQSMAPGPLLSYPLAIDDWPLCLYYVRVLRQIFRDIGYHLQGQVLDTAEWRETLITPAGADVASAWPWGALMLSTASVTAPPARSFIYYAGAGNSYANNAVGFDEPGAATTEGFKEGQVFFLPVPMTPSPSNPTRYIEGDKSRFTAPLAGTYSFTWSATLSGGAQVIIHDLGATGVTLEEIAVFRRTGLGLCILRGGSFQAVDGGWLSGSDPVDETVLLPGSYQNIFGSGSTGLTYGNYSGTATVYLEAGDVVQFCTFAKRKVQSNPDDISLRRRDFVVEYSAATFACTHYENDKGESEQLLYPARFLPPLLQKDVVKDFLTRTNSVIVANDTARVATLLSRSELIQSAGEPIDLTDRCDPSTIEYTPTFGADVCAVVFSPAEAEDPLFPVPSGQKPTTDVVRAIVGTGATEQSVPSLWAPVGFRTYRVQQGLGPFARHEPVSLPTITTQDGLEQPLAEVDWDISSMAPRLLRWVGPDPVKKVQMQNRMVPVGVASWGGVLAWDGIGGAVASYYAETLRQGLRGQLAKIGIVLTPSLFRQLTPGRRVLLSGALYTVEGIRNFSLDDEAALTETTLLREVP